MENLTPLQYACKFGDRLLKEVKIMLSKSTHVDANSGEGKLLYIHVDTILPSFHAYIYPLSIA